jgi:uncharacterized membrane-anchored protein
VDFFGAIVALTYQLPTILLVVSYPLEAREQTEKLLHQLFSEDEAAELKEVSRLLKESGWRQQAAVHYGMLMDVDEQRILMEGHYWLPQAAQTFLEKKSEKPPAVTVRKVSETRKADIDNRLRQAGKLFRRKTQQ